MTEKVDFYDKDVKTTVTNSSTGEWTVSAEDISEEDTCDIIENPDVSEEFEEAMKRLRRRRMAENVLDFVIFASTSVALCSMFYLLGGAVGSRNGYVKGYNDGLVSGERNILLKVVDDMVWKVD